MNSTLTDTVHALLAGDKGLLATEESNATCNKRFAAVSVPQTEAARRDWRELIITTPGLADSISGVILFDQTIRQTLDDGTSFVESLVAAGIVPGIKVDRGATAMALHGRERITEGLDGLRERLAEYAGMGARFTKWRAVMARFVAEPKLHRSQRSLRRADAGSRPRACRRARSADGRCAHVVALRRGHRRSARRCLRRVESAARAARGAAAQAEHGRPGTFVPAPGGRRRGCRGDIANLAAQRPGGGSGDRLPVRRPACRTRLGATVRDQRAEAGTLGADLFILAGDPAGRSRNLARQRGQRGAGAGFITPRAADNCAARRGEYNADVETAPITTDWS